MEYESPEVKQLIANSPTRLRSVGVSVSGIGGGDVEAQFHHRTRKQDLPEKAMTQAHDWAFNTFGHTLDNQEHLQNAGWMVYEPNGDVVEFIEAPMSMQKVNAP